MKLAGAGLGKDLNVAEPDPFVLGGKGILVDHDLTNSLLVRKHRTGGKPIDKNLCAIGARGWSRQGIQLRSKFVRII